MAEKNDDIKNLFLNLGLNPSDYHEIRTAPSANATVSEAPRRWSLLQAATSKPLMAAVPAPIMAAVAVPVAASVSVVSASLFASPADKATASSNVAAALFAAANDIARAEASKLPAAEMPVAAPLPSAVTAPSVAASNAADDLRSLFQSVKEPQTVTELPNLMDEYSARRTDQLHGRPAVVLTPTQRVAGLPSASGPLLMPSASRLLPDDEAETRIEQPPALSRLGPIPALTPSPIAAAEGRLRFATPMAEPVAAAHGDSLQDVFRRLSRDNRG